MSPKRITPWIAIGYGVAAILLWLSGRLWGGRILDGLSAIGYAIVQVILGPLAFPLNLGAEFVGPSLMPVWLFFFLVATVLLPVCLRLVRARSPFIKGTGIVCAVVVWLASAALNLLAMLQGI